MKEQTALEWFYDKIKDNFEGDKFESITFAYSIAKQKERSKQ